MEEGARGDRAGLDTGPEAESEHNARRDFWISGV